MEHCFRKNGRGDDEPARTGGPRGAHRGERRYGVVSERVLPARGRCSTVAVYAERRCRTDDGVTVRATA